MTGLDAEINIMPIQTTINQKEYKIYSISKPSNPNLLGGGSAWYFKLDPDFNDIKSKIDAKIKVEEKAAPGVKVATALNPKLVQKLINWGYPQDVIDVLSKEDVSKIFAEQLKYPQYQQEIQSVMNDLAFAEDAGAAEDTKEPGTEAITEEELTLKNLINKTVYYGGKPYVVKKEGSKFILDSQTTTIELEATGDENINDLDISYYRGETYRSGYQINFTDESIVTVNGTRYEIKTDDLGNVIGLSPENKPEQVIKNEKLLVAVEIERNKIEFINTIDELENVDYEDTMSTIEDTDPDTHLKLANVDRIYHVNWNTTVESGLAKLYDKKELTESEKLAVDLWATEAWMEISKLNEKSPSDVYNNALTNIEIINTLLYEGYKEYVEETGVDESTKRTVKKPASRKSKKSKSTKTEVTPASNVDTTEIEKRRNKAYKSIRFNYSTDSGYYGVYTNAKGEEEVVEGWNQDRVREKLKQKYDAEIEALGEVKTTQEEGLPRITVDEVKDKLDTIKEAQALEGYLVELRNAVKVTKQITLEDSKAIALLVKAKKAEFENAKTEVSKTILKKGDTVIVTDTIFSRNKGIIFANTGSIITVVKSTEKDVTFTYNKRTKTVPLSELDKHVTTMPIAKAKEAQKADEKLDEIDKSIIAESVKVVKDFIKSDDAIQDAQTKADTKTLADIYKDLLNDLDC